MRQFIIQLRESFFNHIKQNQIKYKSNKFYFLKYQNEKKMRKKISNCSFYNIYNPYQIIFRQTGAGRQT